MRRWSPKGMAGQFGGQGLEKALPMRFDFWATCKYNVEKAEGIVVCMRFLEIPGGEKHGTAVMLEGCRSNFSILNALVTSLSISGYQVRMATGDQTANKKFFEAMICGPIQLFCSRPLGSCRE